MEAVGGGGGGRGGMGEGGMGEGGSGGVATGSRDAEGPLLRLLLEHLNSRRRWRVPAVAPTIELCLVPGPLVTAHLPQNETLSC